MNQPDLGPGVQELQHRITAITAITAITEDAELVTTSLRAELAEVRGTMAAFLRALPAAADRADHLAKEVVPDKVQTPQFRNPTQAKNGHIYERAS